MTRERERSTHAEVLGGELDEVERDSLDKRILSRSLSLFSNRTEQTEQNESERKTDQN
jgi:hypothetical protein